MKLLEIVREQRAALAAERAALLAEADELAADRDAFGPEQETRGDEILARVAAIAVEDEPLAARETQLVEAVEAAAAAAAAPTFIKRTDPIDTLNDRNASGHQLADAVTRQLETRGDLAAENLAHTRAILVRHAEDRDWARDIAARSTDVYTSAFMKVITGRDMHLTVEERAAMAVGTNTAGGVSVPTHLDPTLILTNSGTSNAIRGISRVVTLTVGNVWNGVSTAGITASWDGELVEVSDDTPNDFARVSVPLYKAQAFAQASVEALEDIGSLQSDLLMLFADARDRLEGTAHATGSGSSQPTGIFTALDANTNVEIVSTTAATIGLVDLQGVYRSVPVRWRGASTWLMNPLHLGSIQALGTAISASYSTDITQSYTSRLLGRPVVESDDAPSTATTTVRDNEIVLGDFNNYLIVDKPGSMSVTYIPVMFNTSNNLPDGRVGWHVMWRSGADSINDLAFRLLQDKTSA